MKAPALMITCEHASNAVPDFVLRALRDSKIPDDVLASHRAYDIGAYKVFSILVKRLKPDFHCSSRFTRLVVDMNRSATNKTFFRKLKNLSRVKFLRERAKMRKMHLRKRRSRSSTSVFIALRLY